MTLFNTPRVQFGRSAQAGDALPAPILGKGAARRTAQLAEAADLLKNLPEPGQSLHCIQSGRFDLMHALVVLVDRLQPVEVMRIATLSFNGRNLAEATS